ncbi:MAG: hypothetical protein Q9220_001199 [cf. Caloplaca sp. 1 TL-2023]
MRLITFFAPLSCLVFALFILPSIQGRPRALSKQERIASILALKPMHTTALLAGAAMPTPSPYPAGDSDLGYVLQPPEDNEDDDEDDDELDEDSDQEPFKVDYQVELKR